MTLIALGINHRTAPVDLREQVAFSADRLPAALRELAALPEVSEAAILSTCNRTELYCCSRRPDFDQITDWLGQFHSIANERLQPYLYRFPDMDAVRHLLRVAGGLDSMILGEPQILGQVKQAYQQAVDAGTLHVHLERLFQHTFSVAKQIRTDTAIGESPVSVAFAAVSLARQIFGELAGQTALLIGAGETVELTARHLSEHNLGRLVIANRTPERAHQIAMQFGGYGIGLDEIPTHLVEADIVISSTAAEHFIVDYGMVKTALKARRHKPVLMVDIAVPRDIDPRVAKLDDVYLYTVDDLKEVIEDNLRSRQRAAEQAEEIIEVQVQRFMAWLRAQDATDSIRRLRGGAETERDHLLERARQMIAAGRTPEEALHFLAHTLTNKLIHEPTVRLRKAGEESRHDLLEAAMEIFNLRNKK